MDFALSLLPWKLLWGLQMQGKERVGVIIAMSMGILYVQPESMTDPSTRWPSC